MSFHFSTGNLASLPLYGMIWNQNKTEQNKKKKTALGWIKAMVRTLLCCQITKLYVYSVSSYLNFFLSPACRASSEHMEWVWRLNLHCSHLRRKAENWKWSLNTNDLPTFWNKHRNIVSFCCWAGGIKYVCAKAKLGASSYGWGKKWLCCLLKSQLSSSSHLFFTFRIILQFTDCYITTILLYLCLLW